MEILYANAYVACKELGMRQSLVNQSVGEKWMTKEGEEDQDYEGDEVDILPKIYPKKRLENIL